jgi:hypothetical protein
VTCAPIAICLLTRLPLRRNRLLCAKASPDQDRDAPSHQGCGAVAAAVSFAQDRSRRKGGESCYDCGHGFVVTPLAWHAIDEYGEEVLVKDGRVRSALADVPEKGQLENDDYTEPPQETTCPPPPCSPIS